MRKPVDPNKDADVAHAYGQGAEAYSKGWKIESCPDYDMNVNAKAQMRAWRKGWRDCRDRFGPRDES